MPRGYSLDCFRCVGYSDLSSIGKEVSDMYHIVEFHADGGQMCVPGRRSFADSEKARQFAEQMRSKPGHTCGPASVKEYISETNFGNEGAIYPEIANIGRY